MIKICLNSSKYLSSTPLHRFGVVRSRIWRIGCARTFCKDERPLAEIIGDTKRGIPRTYPSFMYRWAEAIDEKIGHWKIWRVVIVQYFTFCRIYIDPLSAFLRFNRFGTRRFERFAISLQRSAGFERSISPRYHGRIPSRRHVDRCQNLQLQRFRDYVC